MPAEITNRGFTNQTGTEDDKAPAPAPRSPWGGGAISDYEDISFRAIALNATRDATTKKLAVSDLATKVTMADNADWQVLEWDPEAGLVVIVSDAAILLSTDKDALKASEGFPLALGVSFPLHVAGSPVGRVYVRRAGAGQPNITAYAFGGRNMAFASRRIFNTPSDQD